jgi:orotate phosphoribosyltransferase
MTKKTVAEYEILGIFKKTGALKEGHFILTSGRHSAHYFQCALVLQYPEYCEMFAEALSEHYSEKIIDVVIAPAIGGIVIAQEVGRQLGKKTIFAEREEGRMILRRGFSLRPQDHVLICEDVVTTGGSVQEIIDLVRKAGAVPVGVAMIVDRSDGSVDFGIDQFFLIRLDVVSFNKSECPLCQNNIPSEKPGSRAT